MNTPLLRNLVIFMFLVTISVKAQPSGSGLKMSYVVSMANPASKTYQVVLKCDGLSEKTTDFKIPAWMPGYYQILKYADFIHHFKVTDSQGGDIKWEKANHNTWRVSNGALSSLVITYDVEAKRSFVATNYLDEERGFIAPTGMFLHIAGKIKQPVTIAIEPYKGWNRVATGLEPVKGKPFTYTATDFDVLYDSPLLVGALDELPSFTVRNVPHYFIGYKLGTFEREAFIGDLKKVVEAAVDVIGEIPFSDYTFIGTGPGAGGIEHLNSTAVSFSGGPALNTPQGRKGVLSFLGHEYFHHYNAKRIRPVELGPFDYDNGSRTRMLWVAEGVTSYYDDMILRWAGLVSGDDILKTFQNGIRSYETSPGRLFQSVTQASYDTWSDGPFGRKNDEVNKTVSYYEKGPVLALMLDFKIRHETRNKKSLDDVMRTLYFDFYKKKNRGYTEAEFRAVCEAAAGVSLEEFFNYVYTVQEPDYKKYFAYAGLEIDTEEKTEKEAWLGIKAKVQNDSLLITNVDWESPAWQEGVRRQQVLLSINGEKADLKTLEELGQKLKPGDLVKIGVVQNGKTVIIPMLLSQKTSKSFEIKRKSNPAELEKTMLKSWLKE
ncbi:PDZ domain-containing protein [Emticicia sp. CRIBPO]|uniref:M61 family metallopeptidase n=1 Tax=Emticicia sp. CRIBPO TaxID=2683258 RepID=UPI0014123FF1|nr:PDZ domain-containing protein [Emticicia sp. CRIBPO]NBA87324.1 PDZ domain-containing protein [Emticicia sp. CRIBPO]